MPGDRGSPGQSRLCTGGGPCRPRLNDPSASRRSIVHLHGIMTVRRTVHQSNLMIRPVPSAELDAILAYRKQIRPLKRTAFRGGSTHASSGSILSTSEGRKQRTTTVWEGRLMRTTETVSSGPVLSSRAPVGASVRPSRGLRAHGATPSSSTMFATKPLRPTSYGESSGRAAEPWPSVAMFPKKTMSWPCSSRLHGLSVR